MFDRTKRRREGQQRSSALKEMTTNVQEGTKEKRRTAMITNVQEETKETTMKVMIASTERDDGQRSRGNKGEEKHQHLTHNKD